MAPGRATVFAGEGGCRKGWFVQAMQLCGAAGLPLLGFPLREGMRSVYFDFEQTEFVTRERYQALASGYGIDLAGLGKRVGYRWQPVPTLAPRTTERQEVIDLLSWHTEGLDLAIVDSVRACSPGVDENSVFSSAPLDVATAVSERTGVVFGFLDHAGKPARRDAGPSDRTRKHSQRGHSSKTDAGQTLFIFSATKGAPTFVTCERSQIAAEDAWPADFRFTLAKSEGGGLYLQLIEPPEQRVATPDEELSELSDALLDVVRSHAGASFPELVKLVGKRMADVRAARDALERRTLIVNKGSKKEPRWYPVANSEATST
jgi:hypothetical protein